MMIYATTRLSIKDFMNIVAKGGSTACPWLIFMTILRTMIIIDNVSIGV